MSTAILLIWLFSALFIIFAMYWSYQEDLPIIFVILCGMAIVWLLWTIALVSWGGEPWLNYMMDNKIINSATNSLTIEK